MKNLILVFLLLITSCTKAISNSHVVRIITFAVDTSGQYVTPTNTAMYLGQGKCVCFPDPTYGINTNPTFNLQAVNDGEELRIISFINAGEDIQYKTIRVYVDNRIVYNVSNVVSVDAIVNLR